jgi:phosphatidylserine/phosphatidylglycerophosphate/cardiolipin synthase-like enzyme
MRKKETEENLSVHAIAGSYVVLFGIDMDEAASEGVLGFAIERIDHSETEKRDWLAGFRTFKDGVAPKGKFATTREHPLQTFMWCDFTVRKNREYTYRIVAMRGTPDNLEEGESVSVRIQMENEEEGKHTIYFNRGVAGSQAYLRKFGNKRPEEVPDREAWRWLSRGLFRALLNFIKRANGPEYGLCAAVYEFNQGGVVQAFADAAATGAEVKIVFDARQVISKTNHPDGSKLEPCDENRKAIEKAGIKDICTERTKNPQAISHNKFIILLKDGKPIEVWTGSTNMTDGGIFGHSNVGHLVRDPKIAAQYLKYWEKLQTDPETNRKEELDEIRPWNDENFPVPEDLPAENSTITIFSPRRTLDALNWYGKLMDNAQTAVFLTAAFGVNDMFKEILGRPRDYLRYLLLESKDEEINKLAKIKYNNVAVGNVLEENEFNTWMKEQLTDLNRHVKYIHTKYMLINPLSDDPIVITGSANFSDASTRRNDENMLIIRGDTRVADIYLGEFMRLFNHFKFREFANRKREVAAGNGDDGEEEIFLTPDDSWRLPFYETDSIKAKERQYFAGN